MLRNIILDHSPNLEIVSIIPRLVFQGLFKPLRQFWILSRTRNFGRPNSLTTLAAASTIKSPLVCEVAEFFLYKPKNALSPQQRKPALDSSATAYFLPIPIQETPSSSISLSLSSAVLKLSELGRTVQWDEVTECMCMCCTAMQCPEATASATQGVWHLDCAPCHFLH